MNKNRFTDWLSTFILCFLFWLLLVFSLQPREILLGLIVSAIVAWVSCRLLIHESAFYLYNPVRFVLLLFYAVCIFLVELIKANIAMARIVLSPGLDGYKPGVIRIPAAKNIRSLYGLDMVANSITLTPGTITMEVAEDAQGDNYFYVQWASVEETDREKAGDIIKGRMENWIGRIWR